LDNVKELTDEEPMDTSDAGPVTRQRKSTSDAIKIEPASKPSPHYLRSNTEPLNVYTSLRANLRPVVSSNVVTSVKCPAPLPSSRSSTRSVRQIFSQPSGNRSHRGSRY
uniref:Movement protein n=1 Tax=Rodentolepis nana TaxID=102285 RepID=A0A0R3TQS8_RODNA